MDPIGGEQPAETDLDPGADVDVADIAIGELMFLLL